MKMKPERSLLAVLMAFLCLGVGLQGQASRTISSPQGTQDLERRIQELEETVRELKRLIQDRPSGTESSERKAVLPESAPAPAPGW